MTSTGLALVQMLALVGVAILLLGACAAVGSALGRELDKRSSAAPRPRWDPHVHREGEDLSGRDAGATPEPPFRFGSART